MEFYNHMCELRLCVFFFGESKTGFVVSGHKFFTNKKLKQIILPKNIAMCFFLYFPSASNNNFQNIGNKMLSELPVMKL